MQSLPHWKSVYKTINGDIEFVSKAVVKQALIQVETELIDGLTIYKPYTNDGLEELNNKGYFSKRKDIIHFLQAAGKVLCLDPFLTYSLFCNYLMFEYYGSIDDVYHVLKVPEATRGIIEKLWHFYHTERMFQLKAMRLLVQTDTHKNEEVQKAYDEFLTEERHDKIRTTVFNQFEMSIKEIDWLRDKDCTWIRQWVDRNNMEQTELIVVMLYLNERRTFNIQEFLRMFGLFKQHGFGSKPPGCIDLSDELWIDNIHLLVYMQHAAIICALQDVWNDDIWLQFVIPLEKEFKTAINNQGLLYFIMSILLLALSQNLQLEDLSERVTCYVEESFTDEAFIALVQILEQPALKDTHIGQVIRRSFFKFFNQLCTLFLDSMYRQYGKPILYFLAMIMDSEDCCKLAMDPNYYVHHYVGMAMNLFPNDFKSLTVISTKLLKCKEFRKKVYELLLNMETYCEPMTHHTNYVTNSPTKMRSGIIIPPGSLVNIIHEHSVFAYSKPDFGYNYFNILSLLFEKIVPIVQDHSNEIDKEMLETLVQCCYGLELMHEIIKDDETEVWKDFYFRQCVDYVEFFVASILPYKDKLSAFYLTCFKVYTKAWPRPEFSLDKTKMGLSIFPIIIYTHLTHDKLIYGNPTFERRKIFEMLERERHEGNVELLFTVFDFWFNSYRHYGTLDLNHIPFMVYFIGTVFPDHLNWSFNNEGDKYKLSNKLLSYIFEIMRSPPEFRQDEHGKLIFDYCTTKFFHDVDFIKTFLFILRLSNTPLEVFLCKDLNWKNGPSEVVIESVRTCMSMILWSYQLMPYEEFNTTRFWREYIYSNKTRIHVLKIILSYVTHKFDTKLPSLATSLLKKFAMDPTLQILSALEMDNYQIHSLFVERLHDPSEDPNMKVQILELIRTSVVYQCGLTAAFFDLLKGQNIKVREELKTIQAYLNMCIDTMDSNVEQFNHSVQMAILDLFHLLWVEKKKLLIKQVINNISFWKVITKPLFVDYILTPKTYSLILDILSMELLDVTLSETLKMTFENIFCEDSYTIRNFPNFIINSCRDPIHKEQSLRALHSWKKIVVLYLYKYHYTAPYLIHKDTKTLLTNSTLQCLVNYVRQPSDMRILKNCAELYLYIITHLDKESYKDDSDLQEVISVMQNLEVEWCDISIECKTLLICIAIKTFEHFIKADHDIIFPLLEVIRKIIEREYEYILSIEDSDKVEADKFMPWVQILIFIIRYLPSDDNDEYPWIHFTNMFPKAIKTNGIFFSHKETISVAKINLRFIELYLSSPHYKDFAVVKFPVFFEMAIPLVFLDYKGKPVPNVDYEEFWLTYTYLVRVTVLLYRKFRHNMDQVIVDFTNYHHVNILAVLEFPKFTMEPVALKLTAYMTRLCNLYLDVMIRRDQSSDAHIHMYYNSISHNLHRLINIFLKPSCLRFYKTTDIELRFEIDHVPLPYLTNIMERVVEIIGLSCLGYQRISPKILEMLKGRVPRSRKYLTLEEDFVVPCDFISETYRRFTFGGLLGIVQYMCKTLNQIRSPHDCDKSAFISTIRFVPEIVSHETSNQLRKMSFRTVIARSHEESLIHKFAAFNRYSTPELYLSVPTWLSHMNVQLTEFMVEISVTLLVSQVYQALKLNHCNWYDFAHLKREFCSELQFFHEFVRKKLLDPEKYTMDGNGITKHNILYQLSTDHTEDYFVTVSHLFLHVFNITP